MKRCIACGMPMEKEADFAAGDTSKDYCIYCAQPNGSMQSFEEKKAGMIEFTMKAQGFDEKAAAKIVENNMKRLPAWKNYFKSEA